MRARQLKPGVFKNEALAEIAPSWGRLLFMGLWGLADREGRLLDRPGHIAVEIFPYDLANGRLSISQVDEMLIDLAKGSDPFIFRYAIGEQKIIQIVNFAKHQSPHNTEKASELSEYQDIKKKKRSPKLTVNPSLPNGGNRPDRGLLTPDTGHRTPDSLTKEDKSIPAVIDPTFSVQDLAVLWNEMAPPELAKVNLPFKRPPKDMAQVADVLKRHPDREWWEEVILKIHQSPFLRGGNERRWKANIDFMVKKAEEIRDGKYDEGQGPEPKGYKGLRDFMLRHSAADLNN